MRRGFLSVFYRSEGPQAAIHRNTTLNVWKACLMIAVKTFRFNNPDAPLYILDIHNQLSPAEKKSLRKFAYLEDSQRLQEYKFGGDLYNKIIALRYNHFEETCVFDLDFIFTGNIENVFDLVKDDLGVLHYPNYLRTKNRINSAIIVHRNQGILDVLERQRKRYGPALSDEDLIDFCLSEDLIAVTRLPDSYGKSKQMWWAKAPEELTPSCASKWIGALSIEWSHPRPIFWLGQEQVLAFHFSGAKEIMVSDPLVKKYLKMVDQWLYRRKD